jgi:hypothetical protein
VSFAVNVFLDADFAENADHNYSLKTNGNHGLRGLTRIPAFAGTSLHGLFLRIIEIIALRPSSKDVVGSGTKIIFSKLQCTFL